MADSPISLVINLQTSSGRLPDARERILELCAAAHRAVRPTFAQGVTELVQTVERALNAGAARIVAGGGDGTLSAVAGVIQGRDVPLGVLPLGSLNHFARDLGIPLELGDAFQVALGETESAVDVGEVNGRVFLNNLSLGVYPEIVRLRALHPSRGLAKWLVALWATLRELWRARSFTVRIDVPGESVVRHTPILFLGNNRYRVTGVSGASRDSLRSGVLATYVVGTRSRWGLFRLGWRMLLDRVRAGELEQLDSGAVTIEPLRGQVRAALDGELVTLTSPLHCRSRPGALRVMVPPVSVPSDDAPPPARRCTPTATRLPR